MSLTTAFFEQLEFLHTVCMNLENRFEQSDTNTVQEIVDEFKLKEDKLSKGMAIVIAKVLRDCPWLGIYMQSAPTPANYAVCYAEVCRHYYRNKAVESIQAFMRGVRYAQYFVHRRSTRSPPMTGVELVKTLYEERAWIIRWQAEQFLDVATHSQEAIELDCVLEAIKACDFSWELEANFPKPLSKWPSPHDDEDDWDLPPQRPAQPSQL